MSQPPRTPQSRRALVMKMQILGAVLLPLAVVGLWLGSKGFFQPIQP